MAHIKAIFDADILIHLIKTDAIDFAIETLGVIHISEYVYNYEIKSNTNEAKVLNKLKHQNKIKILEYNQLTTNQKHIYNETYKLLKKEDIMDNKLDNPIDEGERVTACFAKACNIYYYMSDDNKAASHIKSLTAVDIVNFCDLLFLHIMRFDKKNIDDLRKCYVEFIGLYDQDKLPRILKNKGGLCSFEEMMARSYQKFNDSLNLKKLLVNIKQIN